MSKPRIRCAIYTRKSSDEGLDQDFNSLDAQAEVPPETLRRNRTSSRDCGRLSARWHSPSDRKNGRKQGKKDCHDRDRGGWRSGRDRHRTFFCGCRSVCKEFLIVEACDRVRSFVRPVRAADKAPLAGMVMRGPGPNLQQRARSSENVSGLPDPDRFDHLPIRIMPSSQLGGPVVCPPPFQAPISTGP